MPFTLIFAVFFIGGGQGEWYGCRVGDMAFYVFG